MPVPRNWSSEWLWTNSQRNYPILSTSSGEDATGSFTLPNTFLLDLCFPVDAALAADPGKFHVHQIACFANGYTVTLGYDGIAIGTFSVSTTTHTWGKQYVVYGMGDYENSVGLVACGYLDDMALQPLGIWTFNLADAIIQPRCIIPSLQGLTGLRVLSNGVLSDVLTGDITLEAGRNARLRIDVPTKTIWFDAIGNEDYIQDCVCDDRDTGTPITRINGVAPTASGDMTLVPLTCIDINTLTNGLSIQETCSSPCCGCEELDIVNSALDTLRNQFATLTNYASRLDGKINEMDTVITQTIAMYPEHT